ncbi:Rapamycin-insensitive companion of mTOR, middle domain-containing protein [Melampsora americana]|nr:Rapamycin-insensitive companion of mTOR, middle domain-containing protein [Melampsora americana]
MMDKSCQSFMSTGLVRAIVSLAETSEEKLRQLAIETLGELMVRDFGLLAESDGIKVLMSSLTDGGVGSGDLAPYMAATIMAMVDRPMFRQYLRPGVDFEIALAGITEAGAASSQAHDERVRASARLIVFLMKSWTGLIAMVVVDTDTCYDDQLILLSALFEIFQIKTSTWYSTFMAGKRLTFHTQQPAKETPEKSSERSTLVEHFLAVILLVFFDVNLLETLIEITEAKPPAENILPSTLRSVQTSLEKASEVRKKASLLIAEILDLSNRVLPLHYGTRIQSLPRLFELAASFQLREDRSTGTAALREVDSLHRTKQRLASPFLSGRHRSASNSAHRINLINIDDFTFRALVIETQVLVTKDHTRWNIEKLLELMEGTLYMNPKRLEELTRSTKIMKRVLGFLHPFEGRYPYIKRTKASEHTSKYTKLACSTLQTLLSDSVGVRFLSEDKLVDQIGLGLRQLDPHSGTTSQADSLFSQARVEDTLAHGYFEMLGTLSRYPEGIKLMEKCKIFTSFYALCEMRSRDDLMKEVIENIDYSINGHCRLVLSKALTSTVKHVRLFATHHLEKLISRGNLSSPSGMGWLIRLLFTQLYDPSPEVCGLAVEILEEACAGSTEVLETVVNMRPALENLGDVGAPLLLRFLSTSVGARYLKEIDWTEREMDEWYRERNRDYVIQLEMYLSKVLNADGTRDEEDEELIASADGTPPPHFYGELVKTEEGRELLRSKGHFQAFLDTIRKHGLEETDLEVINELKTALWAIGNIGSSAGGLTFLEPEGVIDEIAEIAETSNVFSVRGTCCYILGLISSTLEGSELLSDSGWKSVQTPLGTLTGICVPERLDEFIVHPTWRIKKKPLPDLIYYSEFQSNLQRSILVAIANLSNHLLANNSSRTLARIKLKHREVFQDPALFHRALRILANYPYRLLTRRYVLELFGDIGLDMKRVQEICNAGEAMRMTRSETNHTITQEYQNRNRKMTYEEDEEEEEIEVKLNELPIRSGTGLLEAYDKTDYFSDESEEGGIGVGIGSKKLIGGGVGMGKSREIVTHLEPMITIRGFLLS